MSGSHNVCDDLRQVVPHPFLKKQVNMGTAQSAFVLTLCYASENSKAYALFAACMLDTASST